MHTKLIAMGTASGGHPLGARYFFIAAVGGKQKEEEEEEIKCIAIGNTLCSDTRELLPLLSNEPYFFLYLVSFIAKGTSLSIYCSLCVFAQQFLICDVPIPGVYVVLDWMDRYQQLN